MRKQLSANDFDFIAILVQQVNYFLFKITLNHNFTIFRCAAHSTFLFQFFR